ncbi:MAG: peptide chain release factor N(5)-glutamine methyltransferase [Alphaproteobacteria bacterium]
MTTVAAAATIAVTLDRAAEQLRRAGIDRARSEARLLMAAALGIGRDAVFGHPERPLAPGELARVGHVLSRRAAREPVAHILGAREFWSLDFTVTADTLVPRPDSETLIEAALEVLPKWDGPYRILDLGTGGGCLLLALLHERPNATGLGIDKCAKALEVAKGNADALGLAGRAEFQIGDWARGLDGTFDVIVANPPYIPEDEIGALAPEVAQYEPKLALSGGADGLQCYRRMALDLMDRLVPGGTLVIEVGCGQATAVAAILARHGLTERARCKDLGGQNRCILAKSGTN